MINSTINNIIYDIDKEKLVIFLQNKDYYFTDLSKNNIKCNKSNDKCTKPDDSFQTKLSNRENLINLLSQYCSSLKVKNYFNKKTLVNIINENNIDFDLNNSIKLENKKIISNITSSINYYNQEENKNESNIIILVMENILNYINELKDSISFFQIKKKEKKHTPRDKLIQTSYSIKKTNRLSKFKIGGYIPTKEEVYFIRTFCHCNDPKNHKCQLNDINYKIPEKVLVKNSFSGIYSPKLFQFKSTRNSNLNDEIINNDNFSKTINNNNKFKLRIKSAKRLEANFKKEKVKLLGFKDSKIKKYKITPSSRYEYFPKPEIINYLKDKEIEKKVNPKYFEFLKEREKSYEKFLIKQRNKITSELKKKGILYKKTNIQK